MPLSVSDIQKSLQLHFYSHKYELFNSYVFNWECDFFSITDSGYCYEVEIKLGRSDFFADFKKDKHTLFKRVRAGQLFYWENRGKCNGDRIGLVKWKEMQRVAQPRRGEKDYNLPEGVSYDWRKKMYVSNQWDDYHLTNRNEYMYYQATAIRFIDLQKVHLPHKFFYACPEGLIKKEEVPEYAGLIYVNWPFCTIVKQPPFLHKRDMDLKHVLLEKFYWECKRLRPLVKKAPDQ